MKKFKKLLIVLTALALVLSPILSTPINAQATESVAYHVRYVPSDNDWKYQPGSWSDTGYCFDLSILPYHIKDGDHLVIDGDQKLILSTDVHLGSLTVVQSTSTVITAKGYDNVYCINGSVCAINGDVKNGFVYDNSVCNFNSNVENLEIIKPKGDLLEATVAVLGTVNHLKAYSEHFTHYEGYSFPQNALYIEQGALKTSSALYSQTAPVAPAPSAPVGAYDSVPKTDDMRFNPLWLVGLAAVCLAGSYALRRKKRA